MDKIITVLSNLQSLMDALGLFLKKLRGLALYIWLRGMQVLCVIFLIVHSQSLGLNFSLFCLSVMCLTPYFLGLFTPYKKASKQKKKLLRWAFIILTTLFVAELFRVTDGTEDVLLAVSKYEFAALEVSLVLITVELVISLIEKTERKAKLKAEGKTAKSKLVKVKN